MNIDINTWIVVKNTPHKNDPRVAVVDYVAEVVDYKKFEKLLKENNQKAYRARSYGDYFPNFESAPVKYF